MEKLEKIEKEIINLVEDYVSAKNEHSKHFVPGITHIPVSGRVLDEYDYKNLISSSLDGWLTAGEYTEIFEKNLRSYLNCRHSLMVNSGSSANLVIMTGIKKLLDLNDGDEVITSGVNFPTTLNPILQNNLIPVLIDVEIGSYNINPELIEKAITKKTKGIVLAHTVKSF